MSANQARTRKAENYGYQRHAIKLTNEQLNKGLLISDVQPQLLLVTSHCASSSFRLYLAMHVFLCGNGMVRWDGEMGAVRIPHTKNGQYLLGDALVRLAGDVPKTLNNIEQFKRIELTDAESISYAKRAIEMRWNGEQYEVDPQAVLKAKRRQDEGPMLWNRFNVIQENIIRGGVPVLSKRTGKTNQSRKIKGIESDIFLNRGLWALAEGFAKVN